MVDGTIATYSSSLSYTAQISSAQETSSISLVEQASVAAISTANGTTYGAAVTFSISTASTSAGGSSEAPAQQDGEQALSTLTQTADEARGFLKKDAQKKLQLAESELKLLKLLGGADGAKQAAQLARQIADAASQYAEGSDPDASDQSATGAGVATPTAPASVDAGASTGASSSAAANAQPSFYRQVDAALATLKKYLQKVLPALALSPDKDTRKIGETAKAVFDQAVAQAEAAEADVDGQSAGAAFQPIDISA
jgi:hypothetical protein